MRELVSALKVPQNSFKLSTQRREMGWESGFLSATPLSMRIMGGSGPSQMTGQAPRSRFLFLAVQGAQPTRLRSEELWSRRAERQVRAIPVTARQAQVRETQFGRAAH